MTLSVFLTVLFSAFFQASWNFLTKKSQSNKTALLAVGWFSFGIALIPLAFTQITQDEVRYEWLKWMAATGCIHAIYLCLLGWAYNVGEISVVYPVSRGMGIAGTTILSLVLGIHTVSFLGAIGIFLILCGTLSIGCAEIPTMHRRHAFFIALLVALSVSVYSIIDSQASHHVPILYYLIAMNILAPTLASPFLYLKMRKEIIIVFRNHKMEAFYVSFAGAIAYSIILWAYQHAPTAYVASLREFSIVIATFLGVVILKERLSKTKTFAVVIILLGVVIIKFA